MLGGSFVPNKYQRLTAEREVAGLNPGTGPTLRVLKCLRNEGTAFSLDLSLAGPRMTPYNGLYNQLSLRRTPLGPALAVRLREMSVLIEGAKKGRDQL